MPNHSRGANTCSFHTTMNTSQRNDRLVLIADGKKIAKSGKKVPGVKSLFQE